MELAVPGFSMDGSGEKPKIPPVLACALLPLP
eukprot:COSAG02_NODE_7110_length_3179_cov_2081.528571_1_plen_31_part_10